MFPKPHDALHAHLQSAEAAPVGIGGPEALVDACLAGVMLGVPWFMGGRHPLGQLLLIVLAVTATLAWGSLAWQRTQPMLWKLNPAHGLLLAALALVGLQLMPLPQPLLHWLSPELKHLLPLWSGDGGGAANLGQWTQISVNPSETRSMLILLLAYGLLFCIALQHVRTVERTEQLLSWLALSVVLLAIVGLLQFLFGNGRFLWIYDHPYRTASGVVLGPFVNPNHFAHMLALGIGPLIWLVQRAMHAHREARRTATQWPGRDAAATGWTLWWRLLGLGLVLLAGLMTFSRAGVAMMLLAAAVTAGLMYHAGLLGRRLLRSLGVIFLLIGGILAVHGYHRDSERLGDFSGQSLEHLLKNRSRQKIWLADVRAMSHFWLAGSGAGSHREVYPRYLAEARPIEFRHVENGYLQVALEMGLPGLLLVVCGLGWCFSRCWVALKAPCSPRVYDCATAVSGGLLVSAVHAFLDYVWFVPATMAVTCLLAACAVRLAQFTSDATARAPSWSLPLTHRRLALGAVLLVCAGGWMINERACAVMAAPHIDATIRAVRAHWRTGKLADEATIEHLEQLVYWRPDDARAHLRLAAARLARCEWLPPECRSALPLSSSAATDCEQSAGIEIQERFTELASLHGEDLDKILSSAKTAVQLCPLSGEGYIYLAELCFLNGGDRQTRSAFVQQALRVRPYDPPVLLAAGNEAALAGDLATALDNWRMVFEAGPDEREQLVSLLVADRVPIERVLEHFQPDLEAVRVLDSKYTDLLVGDSLANFLQYYLRVGERTAGELGEAEAAPLWAEMNGIYKRLGQPDKSLRCLRRAAAGRPDDVQIRSTLAFRLFDEQQYAEAEMHLKWCLQRHPDDDQLNSLLNAALRRRAESDPPNPAALPATRR